MPGTQNKSSASSAPATYWQRDVRQYPEFSDADVSILSPAGKTWKLNSSMLANSSTHLRDIFNTVPAAKLKKSNVREGQIVRWKLVLVNEPLATNVDIGGNLYKTLQPMTSSAPYSIFDYEHNGETPRFEKIYDNLFRCIYTIPPVFEEDAENDYTEYILDATYLLQAASYLGARSVVRLPIEAHLLRLNQILWFHVHHKPEAWASLACRIESATIFREAMSHIVGRYHLLGVDGINKDILRRAEFGEGISKLASRKAEELLHLKLNIERRLVQFFPQEMQHKAEADYVPGRGVYATDIYLWQALTIIRQFLTSAYISNLHHRAPDGGVMFYRSIFNGRTFIRQDTINRFHELCDMSPKGRLCLLNALDVVKDGLRLIVKPLLKDSSQAATGRLDRLPYLTCTVVSDEELPWCEPAAISEDTGGV